LDVFLKNYLRFLNGPPNVRDPRHIATHIVTHTRLSRFKYGSLAQPQSGGGLGSLYSYIAHYLFYEHIYQTKFRW